MVELHTTNKFIALAEKLCACPAQCDSGVYQAQAHLNVSALVILDG
jgi:hypothetical protein